MKHSKRVIERYEVDFDTSDRFLRGKINEFLEGCPHLDTDGEAAEEKWYNNHTELRDFEGDFVGIEIQNNSETKPLIDFIFEKLGVNPDEMKGLTIRLKC